MLLATTVAAAGGPAATAADAAQPKCNKGFEPVRQQGKWKCKRKGWDAVTPSKIEIVVGKLSGKQFGATGYFEFAQNVTGSVYGHWVISNGIDRQRLSFSLRNLKNLDYTPFTTLPKKVWVKGEAVTAVLVVGKVRSEPVTLIQ